jgi:hypothetical protein
MGSLRSIRTEAKEKQLSKHDSVFVEAHEILQVIRTEDGRLRLSLLSPEEYPAHWNKDALRQMRRNSQADYIRIMVQDESATDQRVILSLKDISCYGVDRVKS